MAEPRGSRRNRLDAGRHEIRRAMRNSGGERELFEVAHVYRAVYAL
jgi:hypothetical protein